MTVNTMKIWDAIKLAITDKIKIRRVDWPIVEFIYLDTHGQWVDETESLVDIYYEDSEWELFTPKLKYFELNPGDTFYRTDKDCHRTYHKIKSGGFASKSVYFENGEAYWDYFNNNDFVVRVD